MKAYITAFAACVAVVAAISVKVSSMPERSDFTAVAHTVKPGETPWSIADGYCPDGLDKREYLEWCAEENGFKSWDIIYPGESYIFLEDKTK